MEIPLLSTSGNTMQIPLFESNLNGCFMKLKHRYTRRTCTYSRALELYFASYRKRWPAVLGRGLGAFNNPDRANPVWANNSRAGFLFADPSWERRESTPGSLRNCSGREISKHVLGNLLLQWANVDCTGIGQFWAIM